MRELRGNVEVNERGEMDIFGKVYVTINSTCTAPLWVFGSSLFSKTYRIHFFLSLDSFTFAKNDCTSSILWAGLR